LLQLGLIGCIKPGSHAVRAQLCASWQPLGPFAGSIILRCKVKQSSWVLLVGLVSIHLQLFLLVLLPAHPQLPC
jgi:hypothetical protein